MGITSTGEGQKKEKLRAPVASSSTKCRNSYSKLRLKQIEGNVKVIDPYLLLHALWPTRKDNEPFRGLAGCLNRGFSPLRLVGGGSTGLFMRFPGLPFFF